MANIFVDENKAPNHDSSAFVGIDEMGDEYILRKFSPKKIEVLKAPDSLYYSSRNLQQEKIKKILEKHRTRNINVALFGELVEEIEGPAFKPKLQIIGESNKKDFTLLDKKGSTFKIKIVEKSDLLTNFGYVEVLQSPPYFKKLTQEEKIRRLENFWDEYKKKHIPKSPPPKTTYEGVNEEDYKRLRFDYIRKKEAKEETLPDGEKDLMKKTKNELIKLAEDSGVKRLSKKTKSELVEIIKGNIKKKEQVVFTSENDRKIFPNYREAGKQMKVTTAQISRKMGASITIDGVVWKLTREHI